MISTCVIFSFVRTTLFQKRVLELLFKLRIHTLMESLAFECLKPRKGTFIGFYI